MTVDATRYGLVLAARRNAGDGGGYWRMNQFLMPFYTMIAPEIGGTITARAWVPMDDEHCIVFTISYRHNGMLTPEELLRFKRGEVGHALLIPGTTRPVANKDNDYLIDRDIQKNVHFSGIKAIRAQDAAMSESAGPITDRSLEFLGTSDQAIVRARRVMLQAARNFVNGENPEAMRGGEIYAVRSWSALLPGDTDYKDDVEVIRAMRTISEQQQGRMVDA